MKKNQGFTLIELLAVIVILAIILLIATPVILNIIEDVRKGAFKSSIHGYVKAAEYKHLDNMLDGSSKEQVFTYVDGKLQGAEDLDYGGGTPKNGTIHITKEGKIALAIYNGKWCATKNYNSNEINIDENEVSECKIEMPEIVDKSGANAPVLASGMKAIVWNEDNEEWIEATNYNDPYQQNWYDYENKKWANVQTADGSFWVWIPRYAYQIASCYHTNCGGGAGTINVKFLQGKTTTACDGTTIEEMPSYEGSSQTNYIKHPAFNFDGEQLGFWVAKFEVSGSADALDFKPNVPSIVSIPAANMFTYSRNMETNNRYGWGTTGVGIDTHMIKNTEWGAVAYLSQSVYGKNAEVTINNTSSTGGGNYINNVGQSTTGNIYGVYDMSGGALEYVAGIYGSGSDKYYNYYSEYTSSMYGDAAYETSSSSTCGSYSWYSDWLCMPNSTYLWVLRGGGYNGGPHAGVFSFYNYTGEILYYHSWRVVVMVDEGL